MAIEAYLKIEGIEGESQSDTNAKQIDLLSWSWGMNQSGTTHLGSGGGSGKVNVNDMSFTKYLDKSTPALITACCNGRHIPKATMQLYKAGGGPKPLLYLELKFDEILISSYSTGGSSDGLDRVMENISFNFRRFEYTYTIQNEKGGAVGKADAKWDIAKNKSV